MGAAELPSYSMIYDGLMERIGGVHRDRGAPASAPRRQAARPRGRFKKATILVSSAVDRTPVHFYRHDCY